MRKRRPEERKICIKEGLCFPCRSKIHRAKDCPKRPEELSINTSIDQRHIPSDCISVPIAPKLTKLPDRTPPYDPDDLFKTSESRLLISNPTMSGIFASILVDDGAERNHISQEFCIRHGISRKQEQHIAPMANSTLQKLMTTVHPLIVTFGGYTETMRFASILWIIR